MSNPQPTLMIDENEIRNALRPMRPDPNSFAAGVQRRIEQATAQAEAVSLPSSINSREERVAHSAWLQTAAAVIPLPLFGKASGVGLVKLGQLSLSQKIMAIIALPATSLLLMIAGTIWAIVKIRRAQSVQSKERMDMLQSLKVTGAWWRQYGLLIFGMSMVMLLLLFAGYTLPLFLIFMLSGISMVSFITTLGKEHMIDRSTLAGTLGGALASVGQVSLTATMFSQGYPFLDQTIIPAVLMSAGGVMTFLCTPRVNGRRLSGAYISLGLGLFIGGWFSSSLWNPVTTRDLKNFVESFDHARFSSASWSLWLVSAQWLRDSHVEVDWSKPRALLKQELARKEPNITVLGTAMEVNLVEPQELDGIRELGFIEGQLFRQAGEGNAFTSLSSFTEFLIRAASLRGQLGERERDILGRRLTETANALKAKDNGRLLEELLTITKLAKLIDRPLDLAAHRDWVHESLIAHQCLTHRFGTRPGGFNSYSSLGVSDDRATAAAIELMEIYGVPTGVRIDALRSYLRPGLEDTMFFQLNDHNCSRAACLKRLNALPGVAPITWRDFLRYEQNLLMAIMLTLVCVFATLGAPAAISGGGLGDKQGSRSQ